MIKYTITPENVIPANLHLVDSYQVSKHKFQSTLNSIHALHPKSEVWERSMFSLRMEWGFHNFLYMIGYKRERTKDADLDYPCDKPEWIYELLGMLVWIFIK